MAFRREKRRSGFEMLVIPNDGRPARTLSISGSFVKYGVIALVFNVLIVVGLFGLSGWQRTRLHEQTDEMQHLDLAHTELLDTAREQEHQLYELALEAERLASRVKELEQLSDEVWTLLGEEPTESPDVARTSLGQGGPDDGTDDVGWRATLLFDELTERVPRQLEELRELRESVLSRNHRLDHTPSVWPTEGYVSSEFGRRIHPVSGRAQPHQGIDIAAWTGTPVHAPAAGKVALAGSYGGYGLTVIIDHGYGVRTLYAHNSRLHVRVGAEVKRGDLISSVGTTGVSTGPHLHYEVHVNGVPVNPRTYLP